MGLGITVDSADHVLITGSFSETVDFGGAPLTTNGEGDIFVAKYDAGGNHLWSKHFGAGNHDSGNSVAVDSAGNVIATGNAWGTIDFGGGNQTGPADYNIFVVKLAADGSYLWSKLFGGAQYDSGQDVAVDGADNVVLIGFYDTNTINLGGADLANTENTEDDIFVAKLDMNGNHLWSKSFGSLNIDFGYIVTGWFASDSIDFGEVP
jgi:hypothetical protein